MTSTYLADDKVKKTRELLCEKEEVVNEIRRQACKKTGARFLIDLRSYNRAFKNMMQLDCHGTTSFPGYSLYFEKVPWLRLVTCLSMPTRAAPRVSPQLNFVNTTL